MIRFPNGGDLFDFQKDASNWLLDHTLNALDESNTLIVKAPTGSGKTIILLNYIDQYLDFTHDKVRHYLQVLMKVMLHLSIGRP